MNRAPTLLVAFSLCMTCCPSFADTFGSGANEFTVEFVHIGDPNNPDDSGGIPGTAGKVEYTYRMGKWEVSEDMINKANTLGGLGITHDNRGVNKPATSVDWFEAAKFVNWLNTSQGHQAAYSFDGGGNFQLWTSAEAWQTGGENLFRHKDAYYFLPSMDEWYKAAYYDPNAGVYYDYPTGSNSAPNPVANGTAANTAVFAQSSVQGPADISLAGGLSPYGTMGQGGNVWEWAETQFDLVNVSSSARRIVRGGRWSSPAGSLSTGVQTYENPASSFTSNVGFRVASIPEPSTSLLGTLAGLGFLTRRRGRS